MKLNEDKCMITNRRPISCTVTLMKSRLADAQKFALM